MGIVLLFWSINVSKKNNKAFDILSSTQVEHIMPLSGHNINAIRHDAGFADDNDGKEQYRY